MLGCREVEVLLVLLLGDKDRNLPMRHGLLMIVALFSVQSIGCPLASNTIEHGNVSFDVSPNGETIVFSDADGDLWLYALGSSKLTRLTETIELESWPSFSPDGKSVVFVRKNSHGHVARWCSFRTETLRFATTSFSRSATGRKKLSA